MMRALSGVGEREGSISSHRLSECEGMVIASFNFKKPLK